MPTWYMGGALLANADPFFDRVSDYYGQFGAEPTHAADTFVSLSPYERRGVRYGAEVKRFTNFLELIEALTEVSERGFGVLVNHGMSDHKDHPIGLLLPLTKTSEHSPWRVDEYVLGLLAGFIGKSPTNDEFDDLEHRSSITSHNVHLPRGTLKSLHHALETLRDKKLQRLEIRACNLGGNSNALRLLGKVLGVTEAISAPDVHMFYGAVPSNRPTNAAGLRHFCLLNRNARTFTDVAQQRPGTVALQVSGRVQRTIAFAADSVDISWFVAQRIMWGHYPAPNLSAAWIPGFTFAGMDVAGKFALPLEPAYRSHIVEINPPYDS